MPSATTDPSAQPARHAEPGTGEDADRRSAVPAEDLDDERDRDELRQRYYGLVSELRVLLPGVQVLAAFLLTAPFAQRFAGLDAGERRLYAVALLAAVLATVVLVTPAVLHRVGDRRERASRLQQAVILTRIGLLGLAVSLLAAVALVGQVVFDGGAAAALAGSVAVAVLGLWVVLPLASRVDAT